MTAITWRDVGMPTSPLVDAGGNVRPEWRAYFNSLYLRTGGARGQETDTANLQSQIDAEEAARIAADTTLRAGIDDEAALRVAGDLANNQVAVQLVADEAIARVNGDQAVARNIYTETQARIAADASYVPIAQLCTLWAGCNLSFLPTTDPGGGKPWLDGTRISVGTMPGAMVGIGLEDGTGDWLLQDGTGHWLYG